jgi:pyruvate formate lyase activating enzyme
MPQIKPRFWEAPDGSSRVVKCGLCFRECLIKPGNSGFCGVRFNDSGVLDSPFLGKFASTAIDPIEKKPLRHWRPGTEIVSLGGIGCNFACPFCQNHSISQRERPGSLEDIPPLKLVGRTMNLGLKAVAFTYNEPSMQAEYILEASPLLLENGIASVLVTNGAFSSDLCMEFADCVEAMNIDLKTYNDANYSLIAGTNGISPLETVKSNVVRLLGRGVHVELTTLVVPGVSDDEGEFRDEVAWIASLSSDIPLHISRYFPAYRFTAPPTNRLTLETFERVAREKLKFVYLGNVW